MTFKNAFVNSLPLFLSFSLTACGSIRDFTDPARKERQHEKEARDEYDDQRRRGLGGFEALSFDMASEASACDKALETASRLRLELVQCKLEGERLRLDVLGGGLRHSDVLDYTAPLQALNEQVRAMEGAMIQTFFQTMVLAIDSSRRGK